jgi:pimeloyl-ACP methyl ester carboxylesterase
MPIAHVNGVDLAYEEYGSGFPLIWCHEFAGSMESWDAQVHYFARRYRVIVYNARGYPPSGVPADPKAYSQDMAVEDIYGLLRHLGIEQAHVGGLSMGGSATLHFGLRHPEMARSLIIAAAGSGSTNPEEFRATSLAFADRLEREGPAAFADYGDGPTRQQLKRKDPRG